MNLQDFSFKTVKTRAKIKKLALEKFLLKKKMQNSIELAISKTTKKDSNTSEINSRTS